MKTRPRPSSLLTVVAVVCLAPVCAFGGPDDTPRPRRRTTEAPTLRSAPPPVTERETTTTTATVATTHEEIIQPLRQREESVNYRFAYRALTSLGLAGSEADDKPVGYQQIYGPTPMHVYRRPPPPPPRRFRHFAETPDNPTAQPSPTPSAQPSSVPAPNLTPDASPVGSPAPAASPAPDALPEAGILPDPSQEAARGRNDEILSYFQRVHPARDPQAPLPNGVDPAYLQAPEQLPIPPSRATYRVVPK